VGASIGYLLREDAELAEYVPVAERQRATELIRVQIFTVPRGDWEPPTLDHGTIGLLLLSGLMVRRIYLGKAGSADLVGPGDIGRPWEDDLIPGLSPYLSDWEVLANARVALLGPQVSRAIGRWPRLAEIISARFVRRSRSLAYLMAAHSFRMVEDRLLASLWHLASTWGRVTPQGIRIPFRLTHEMLGTVVSAKRPSVSTAMSALEQQGRISHDESRCLILHGEPPDWPKQEPVVVEIDA
jgi:CRP/FNR family cyclic AMP-dependent transcriptional regulator